MNEDNLKIFLTDMDGTLCDYEGQLLHDLEPLRAPCEKPLKELFHDDMPDHIEQRMRLIKRQVGWWKNLPRIESNFFVLEIARRIGFKIEILTKGPKHTHMAWSEKLLWCQNQPEISEEDVTITQRKGRYYGRVLFDDFPEYMEDWLRHRPRGIGIMPATKQNVGFTHSRVLRYDGKNVEEVTEWLERAYAR